MIDARSRTRAALSQQRFDLLVLGGGATGLSVAHDASDRGLSVALVEARDFAQGTSSRATKLLHGGVRYLAQGNIALVREALHERTVLMRNAPHLAQALPFLIPIASQARRLFYGAGLHVYDLLAGKDSLGPTRWMDARQLRQASPHLRADHLKGAVVYTDGQFDDARLAIAIARTAAKQGALLLNHAEVTGLIQAGQGATPRVAGAHVRDTLSGDTFEIQASCVVNATGVWVDDILRMQHGQSEARPRVRPSQGIHAVLAGDWLDGRHAVLVPRTRDGRVLFAVPWLGHTILGTTDTPVQKRDTEPQALDEELDFLFDEACALFDRTLHRRDILSLWAGLRPLVGSPGSGQPATRRLSREHSIWVDDSALVTVTGGKWTTCRAMAQDVLESCLRAGLLPDRAPCRTADLPLVGATTAKHALTGAPGLHLYGNEADRVARLPGAHRMLGGEVSEAMVRFAAREEWAVHVG
ncbi:MAG: FAD-dependent oxidoreductase, partial [Burkholderiaceae bacterium]